MTCLHCGRHISPARELPTGSRFRHDGTLYRQCDPSRTGGTWAEPAHIKEEAA